jgi:hypothetical protein
LSLGSHSSKEKFGANFRNVIYFLLTYLKLRKIQRHKSTSVCISSRGMPQIRKIFPMCWCFWPRNMPYESRWCQFDAVLVFPSNCCCGLLHKGKGKVVPVHNLDVEII